MKILIADDNTAVRTLVQRYLKSWGYEVIEASDGTDAWKRMLDDAPEIAILDWMMPGMDGLELCQQYQSRNDLPFMYFLLLTSKNEKSDLLYALKHGAHDFQSKPIDREELLSRVSVGERLVKAHQSIQARTSQMQYFKENAEQMERLVEERTRQLVHADRLISIGTLSAGLAHEISNALGYICEGAYESQYQHEKILGVLLELATIPNHKHRASILEYVQESGPAIESIHEGINRVISIVEELRTFSRQGDSSFIPCKVNDCVERALRLCQNVLKYHVKVEMHLADNLPHMMGSAQQIEQVLVNLFRNAADAMEGQPDATLYVSTFLSDEATIRVQVEDNGPGIPEAKMELIWNAFYTTKSPEKGTGLGLSISQDIIQKHGGAIQVSSREPKGTMFTIELPVTDQLPKAASENSLRTRYHFALPVLK